MALARHLEDALLGWLLGAPFPAPPKQLYLAFHSQPVPTLGNEIKGWAGGDRIPITAADFTQIMDAPSHEGRQVLNTRALLLGVHTSKQRISSFGLWDAPASGVLYVFGEMRPAADIDAGDPPIFMKGDLALEVD